MIGSGPRVTMKAGCLRRIGRWFGVPLMIALAAWTAKAQAPQAALALTSLTVPETNLPSSCRLRPWVPPTIPVAQAGRTTGVRSNPELVSYPFPANPWLGTEHGLIVDLRTRIDGVPKFPDAPPPSGAEMSRWQAYWVEHIVEGYHAFYDSADGFVEVSAIRFDNPNLATATPVNSVGRRASSVRSDRLVTGPVVIHLVEGRSTDCFDAVQAYVRALR